MSDAAATPALTPLRFEQQGPRTLGVHWADGAQSRIDVRTLRLACRCALCVDERSGEALLQSESVPEDVQPLRIEGVGRYGLRILWSDGHDTGITTFRQLRELGDAGEAGEAGQSE